MRELKQLCQVSGKVAKFVAKWDVNILDRVMVSWLHDETEYQPFLVLSRNLVLKK